MNAIRKILVPTDFSAHSDEAFLAANTLAKATGAEVIVLHVSHTPAVASEGGAFLTRSGDGKMADVWERFKKLQQTDPAVRVEHVTVVADKPSAAHVLEALEKAGCDLIVMGMHGHSWLRHRLFGSLTEEVVRLAHCPVMVVKSPAHKALAAPASVAPKVQASSLPKP
jgi:nucleotide-binding universal stress UspA family protein